MKKLVVLVAGLLSVALFAQAEETQNTKENTFSMKVQRRPRAEYRNGVLFPRPKDAESTGFINNRARFSLGYERDRLSIGLSAQHVGVWGQDPQIDKNGRFILNEAWAKLDFGSGFFAKLGRQSLVYDDERIMGALDWNVAGRYHDAYKHLFDKSFNASFLFMNLGMEGGDAEKQNSDTKYLQTLGTNLIYTPSHWMVGGMFYYQFGKTKSGRDVSAFLWAVNAAYQIDPQWKIGVGSDYLSGSDGADGKYKAFDPLYGTHHKFYGAMDYFYASSFVNGLNPGLWDNQVNVAYKPSSKVNLSLAYHYFSITGDVYEGNDKLSKGLGSELDFQVDWVIMKDVKLSAGYSTMLGTNTMKVVKGGNPSHWQDWGWLSININPTIFTTKW